jgi:hypothetical protein
MLEPCRQKPDERKRAQVGVCKAKARRERQLKKIAEADAIKAVGRDILDLSPRVVGL